MNSPKLYTEGALIWLTIVFLIVTLGWAGLVAKDAYKVNDGYLSGWAAR